MKWDIFWLVVNGLFIGLAAWADHLTWGTVVNAFAVGVITCVIAVRWVEGERPWRAMQ